MSPKMNPTGLNEEQMLAVSHFEGPLLIFAGAGSGKTRVITHRILHLLENKKVAPSHIVALSFTNKSAKEMAERIKKMTDPKKVKGLELSTFHSLGLKITNKYLDRFGYRLPFFLRTPEDTQPILAEILKKRKIQSDINLSHLISSISKIKNSRNPSGFSPKSTLDELAMEILDSYLADMKSANSLDFDDLILLSIELLEKFQDIRDHYRKKYKFLMVDEFQDTNPMQYSFLKSLLGSNQNLCVVGDDDQSIYGFRGSDVQLILNLEKDFPSLKTVKLLKNYRSSASILKAANSLIAHNKNRRHKETFSDFDLNCKPYYEEKRDEKDEAIYIVDKIQKEIISGKRKGSQIAILFRTNFQSRPFEEELRVRSIPYKLVGGYNFFERKEVRDIIAYLRVAVSPEDDLSLIRILNYPKRGLGNSAQEALLKEAMNSDSKLIEVLRKVCEKEKFIPEIKKAQATEIYNLVNLLDKYKQDFFTAKRKSTVLSSFIKEIGIENEIAREEKNEKAVKAKMLNLSELVNMLSYFESDWDEATKPTMYDFLNRLSFLMADNDDQESQESERIQLMTMHLSKGLEFEVVFLAGLEDGVIPNSRSMEEAGDLDEERRLMYVAMTRAKQKLFLSGSCSRRKYGEIVPAIPSRFIQEIDPNLIDTYFVNGLENQKFNLREELMKLD